MGTEVINKEAVSASNETLADVKSNAEDASDGIDESAEAVSEIKEITISDEDAYDTDLELEETKSSTYQTMTAEDIYLKSCEQLGVVPASYFLAHLTDEEMNMSHHGLGPNGTRALAAPLVINTSILTLNIEDNWITAEGMRDISDMLTENCYISNLNVAHNKLGCEGARFVCEMLQENAILRVLNVSRNEFQDSDAQFFAEALRTNFRLKEIDLSGNEFCEVGGEWLGQAIAMNEAVEKINISWNHLRLKGALAVCAGMKVNITIKHLDASWNGFADEGAMAMGEALKSNNTLTWLDLSFNRITEKGATMLAKGLEVNDTLRTLRIGDNPMGEEGALALIKAIVKNEKSQIEDLDIQGVRVGKEFMKLANQLKHRLSSAGSKTCFTFTTNRTDHSSHDKLGKLLKENEDPMIVMQNFLEKKRLRLVDLFRNFDKDLSWKISPAEFQKGIENAGIPFTKLQLRTLMGSLDIDSDGQVNYRELLSGKKDAILRRREMRRKEDREKEKKQVETDKFLTVWNQALKAATTPRGSKDASPSRTPLRKQSVTEGDQHNMIWEAVTKIKTQSSFESSFVTSDVSTESTPRYINQDRHTKSFPAVKTTLQPRESELLSISLVVPDTNHNKELTKSRSTTKTKQVKSNTKKFRHTAGTPNSRKRP